MGEIRIVSPGKTRGYPYPVCKKMGYPYPVCKKLISTVHLNKYTYRHTPRNLSADNILYCASQKTWLHCFFVALLFYVHGKHLRSCRDGQLT